MSPLICRAGIESFRSAGSFAWLDSSLPTFTGNHVNQPWWCGPQPTFSFSTSYTPNVQGCGALQLESSGDICMNDWWFSELLPFICKKSLSLVSPVPRLARQARCFSSRSMKERRWHFDSIRFDQKTFFFELFFLLLFRFGLFHQQRRPTRVHPHF